MKASENIKSQSRWNGSVFVSIAFPLMASILPKCPLCAMAIFSLLGIGIDINFKFVFPLTVALILMGLGAMTLLAKQKKDLKPLFLSVFACTIVIAGKFYITLPAVYYIGLLLLAASIIWNIYLPTKTKCKADCLR